MADLESSKTDSAPRRAAAQPEFSTDGSGPVARPRPANAVTSGGVDVDRLRILDADPGETQEADIPIELQPPPTLTPSKYDLANRRIGLVLDDKWRLDKLLGVGGMAAVYAATHRNGARAAIKLLPFSVATGPEICQRLLREGYLANRIKHPAVTRVLDDQIDYDKEHAYIVMELLEGETARERVERLGPLQPTEAVSLMLALADCLSAAHAANVIHRDIKPENLFITDSGLKVLDFGIARALDGNSNLTQTGTSLGTPAYMSPEQARGKHEEISPRSDLYSFGATLLFLLSGQTIHEGENALELMVRAAWTPAVPARQICPAIPEDLAAVIDRCCAFDAKDRFESAEAVIRALSALEDLPQEPLSRPPPADTRRRLQLPPSEAIRSLPATAETLRRSAPPSRTPTARRVALVVAASVFVLGAGAWLVRSNGATATAPDVEDSEQRTPTAPVDETDTPTPARAAVSSKAAPSETAAPSRNAEPEEGPPVEQAPKHAASPQRASPRPLTKPLTTSMPRRVAPEPAADPVSSKPVTSFPKQPDKKPPPAPPKPANDSTAPIIDYTHLRGRQQP